MRRLIPLVALALTACDAGNRAAPGSDNDFQSPTLVVSTPSEGQQVVPAAGDGVVRVFFDLQGGTLGRGAGSKVRYRLQRDAVDTKFEPVKVPADAPWVVVDDPKRAVSLGKLEPATDPERGYVLTAEVIDKDGNPWTREEPGKGLVNGRARVVRKFTLHRSW